MSLQRLHSRRSAADQERPTQQQNHDAKKRPATIKRQSTRTKARNTRRKRIWDLLSHIPTFTLRFLRLMSFVLFLLPAFIVFVWHYVTCDRVAAYYGNSSQSCIDEQHDSKEDDAKDAPLKNGVCNDVMSSIMRQYNKPKDPFFSRHYLDIYGSRTPSSDKHGNTTKKPVVIFITGGAWIIGYRMWGTLLARALAPFGILVIVPDYRNFPRVNIEGMVQDVDMSIQWVFDHAEEYGGDRNKVVLVGQSAGAHIGGVVVAMKVLDLLRKERNTIESKQNVKCPETEEAVGNLQDESIEEMPALNSTYSPQQLCGFISTSSPDNLVTMRPVFHHHGLSANVQTSIFGGLSDVRNEAGDCIGEEEEDVFEKWSPYHLVMKAHADYASLIEIGGQEYKEGLVALKDIFPKLCVIHGTADKTVPVKEALEFISLLTKLNIPTETRMYKGWSHTDPILEAPMRGDHSYHRDIYEFVLLWTGSRNNDSPTIYLNGQKSNGQKNINRDVFHSLVRTWRSMNPSSEIGGEQGDEKIMNKTKGFDDSHPKLQPICPAVLVEAARFCNPF